MNDFNTKLLEAIPSPQNCREAYYREAVQDISEQLLKYREATFEGTCRDGFDYTESQLNGVYLKELFKAKGYTTYLSVNSENNRNRWYTLEVRLY
jgi:hypothetical protein